MSAADLKLAAIKHFDSDIAVEGDVAIDAAYQTIKRVAGKRIDSSQTLNGALFQTLHCCCPHGHGNAKSG
jgi:hypothetical protein